MFHVEHAQQTGKFFTVIIAQVPCRVNTGLEKTGENVYTGRIKPVKAQNGGASC